MTLDKAVVILKGKSFYGQYYVVLIRLSSLPGLLKTKSELAKKLITQ